MWDVLGEHPEAVEADLCRYPGYGPGGPLAAFWRGEITLRLLRVLVEGLPPDGATARAYRGTHWATADYHLAGIGDDIATLLTAFLNVHRREGAAEVPWPKPGWRPGDPLPQETAESAETKRAEAKAAYERVLAQVMPAQQEGADRAS